MIERTIVLCLQDNDGNSTLPEIIRIELEILHIAGGFSLTEQHGSWLGEDGTVFTDKSIRLVTTVDADQDRQIEGKLAEWCARLRQLSLYTHTTEVEVAFVEPARATAQV